MHHPTDWIAHTTSFVTPVVEHWLEREIAQWVHPMKDQSDDPLHHEQTLLSRSYISLLLKEQFNLQRWFLPTKWQPLIIWLLLEWMKEGRKKMFLFNDALNTFYLRLYGVRHMVKDHSDSEKGNPLLPHRLLFTINSKGSFICTIPQTG